MFIATTNGAASGILGVLLVLGVSATVIGAYFLPTFIALLRGRQSPGVVIVINTLFGWTFIGWCIALAMAFGPTKTEYAGSKL